MQVTNVLTGVAWPEISPDGKYVYFSGYHADGWHLERIGYDTAGWTTPAPAVPTSPDTIGVFRAVDTDTTSGPVTRYSPIATLLPRFWLPIGYTEARRDFTGIATAGVDAINRHSYGVQAAWDPQHREAGWSAGYEYAGLGNPVLQLSTSRSYDGALVRGPSGDTAHYFLVRRDDDASAALTFLRPRVRTAVSLTLGGDITLRHRALDDAPANIRPSNPRDRLAGVFAGLGFANYQAHPYSISREDGLAASAFARRRFSSGAPADLGYSEATSSLRLYRSLPLPGFAHHVLAGRVSGLWRGGPGAEPEDVGGASGQAVDLGLITAGSAGIFLPVRGYPEGERSGTRAWTASLEYRVPIALVGRGWGTRPYYLDRVSADGFVDAGNASCPDADARGVTPRGFVCSLPGARPLLGAGAELLADARILIPTTFRFRAGIGFPVSEGGKPRGWLTLGSSF